MSMRRLFILFLIEAAAILALVIALPDNPPSEAPHITPTASPKCLIQEAKCELHQSADGDIIACIDQRLSRDIGARRCIKLRARNAPRYRMPAWLERYLTPVSA